jgi:hypothetical protein
MGHQVSFKDERLRRGLKPRRFRRVNSARGTVFVVKLSHEGALDACTLSSQACANFKTLQVTHEGRALAALGLELRGRLLCREPDAF